MALGLDRGDLHRGAGAEDEIIRPRLDVALRAHERLELAPAAAAHADLAVGLDHRPVPVAVGRVVAPRALLHYVHRAARPRLSADVGERLLDEDGAGREREASGERGGLR